MRDTVQENKEKNKIEEWKAKHFEDIQAWCGFHFFTPYDIDAVLLHGGVLLVKCVFVCVQPIQKANHAMSMS